MFRTELVEAVARSTGYPDKIARECLDATLNVIMEQLTQGESVNLMGFGNFDVKYHSERISTNVEGRPVIIPEHSVPRFKPCQRLRNSVWSVGITK